MTTDEWAARYETAVLALLDVAPEFQPRVDAWRRLSRSWARIHTCLASAMRARGIAPVDEN